MAFCRLCRQKKPCQCKPYNAIREKGEPGPQGDNAPLPDFVVTVVEGPVGVIIGGTLLAVTIEYSQPAPDLDADYVWLGTNTYTGGFITQGSLTVEVGDGTDDGLYLPGSTITTTLAVSGSTVLNGAILFDLVQFSVSTVLCEGAAYFLGPTTFDDLTINGPLTLNGPADLPTLAISVGTIGPSLITGSTKLGVAAFIDTCGSLGASNSGVILQQLRMLPSWPFSTSPVTGDGDEHVLFSSNIVIGAPACGLVQAGEADLIAMVRVINQAASIGDFWTIRMRLDDPDTGTILDSFRFVTQTGLGNLANWATLEVLLRNTSVPVATGANGIYFTAQSDTPGVDDLIVFSEFNTPTLTVQ